jgi:hypothetical protein
MGRLQHPHRPNSRHNSTSNPQTRKTARARKKATEDGLLCHSPRNSYSVCTSLDNPLKVLTKRKSSVGIFGVWETRTQQADDPFYHEVAFIMMTDVEIFMYALGASFPGRSSAFPFQLLPTNLSLTSSTVLSRYLVQRADPGPGAHPHNSNFSSWARYIPNFFPDTNQTNGTVAENLVELEAASPSISKRRHDSGTSLMSGVPSSKPSRTNSGVMDFMEFLEEGGDVEKGESVRVQTEIKLSMRTEESVLREYVRKENVIGRRW